jgi:hypothetical protein
VEELSILGQGDPADLVNRFFANYDLPAYARRAREVQDAHENLLARCRSQREEWLQLVRLRVGVLRALAGDWPALRPLLKQDQDLAALQQLHDELAPRLKMPVEPTTSQRALLRALEELRDSMLRFNRRWEEFLPTVDLSRVNHLRDGYNRYFLLEKECAVRSVRLARQGFVRLEPVTVADLATTFPLLLVPNLQA